jgi:hypothetical protein
MTNFRNAWLFLAAALLGACAAVTVKPCPTTGCTDSEGVRFYRPAHYALVTYIVNEMKVPIGNDVKLIVLPDPAKEFVIQRRSGFGSASVNATLTDGWNLTAFGASADAKISELVTALTGAGLFGQPSPAMMPPTVAPTGLSLIQPGLYPLNWDKGALKIGKQITFPP